MDDPKVLADQQKPADPERLEGAAARLRERAIRQLDRAERRSGRARRAARVGQAVDYCFFLLYAMLGIRILLYLLIGRSSAGFVRLIELVTEPLYAPFRGMLPDLGNDEGFTVVLSFAFAMGVYGLLHLAIRMLLKLVVRR